MNTLNLLEQIKAAGFQVKLTKDWQQLHVSGDADLPKFLKQKLKAEKETVRTWLLAEAFATALRGRMLTGFNAPADYFSERSSKSKGKDTGGTLGEWVRISQSMLDNRDEKNRLNVTDSEVCTCIIGVRGFTDESARAMHEKLKTARAEAKKFTQRMKAKYRRKAEKFRDRNKPPNQ